jgi:hypothetical protein
MSVARPHTRPHTNRRNRRYRAKLKQSPRLRIASSNPAVESPKWRRSAVLDRTRTARCPFGPQTAACTDARRWSVDAPRECSFGWIGTVTASLLPWSTDAGARRAAIARRHSASIRSGQRRAVGWTARAVRSTLGRCRGEGGSRSLHPRSPGDPPCDCSSVASRSWRIWRPRSRRPPPAAARWCSSQVSRASARPG